MFVSLLRLFIDLMELALLVLGIVAMIRGKFNLTASTKTLGWPARLAGVVAVLLLPTTIVLRILLAAVMQPPRGFWPGQPPFEEFVTRFSWFDNLIYFGVFGAGLALLFGIVATFRNYSPQSAPAWRPKNPFESSEAAPPLEPEALPSSNS